MAKDGLCVIITGAASGLGAAIAESLARDGGRLVINYGSNRSGAEETAERCRAAGGEAVLVQGDVSRDEDCKRIVAAAEPWGVLHALVNNAGITRHVPHNKLDGLSVDDFQQLFAVNSIGPYLMVRAARALLEAGAKASGRTSSVVNVSSVSGLNAGGSSIAYAASKSALNTITVSLARALAPLIRVNAICPSYMDTTWFEKGRGLEAAAKLRESVRERVPLKSVTKPEDAAALVCFLATPQSSQITGELIRLDAGAHLVL